MGTRRIVWAALALVGLAGLGDAAAPHTSTPDRQAVLALNHLTGNAILLGKAEKLTANPAEAKRLIAVAVAMCKERPTPVGRNASLLLGRVAENLKMTDEGLVLYKTLARHAAQNDSTRGIATALLGMLELNRNAKRYADAEKVCQAILSLEGDEEDDLEDVKDVAFRQRVLMITRQGQGDRALKMVDERIKAQPRNFLLLELKAGLQMELERPDDAADSYLKAIALVGKTRGLEKEVREELIADYRYRLSGVYTDANKIDKATEQLETLLAKDPNNPTYNNDLGFIWADRGMNLEKAEAMIRKALEEDRKQRREAAKGTLPKDDKDNASFLDSLGWVLHKAGKSKEAKPHLLAAVKDTKGQHLEIFDHLGDVHLALGEKAEAVASWKKGLEHVTDSKRDKKRKVEVEKKIKDAEGK